MNAFIEVFTHLAVTSFTQVSELLTTFAPKVLFALGIIAFGWLFAIIIRKLVSKVLKMLGFDVFAEKFGLKKILERGGITRTPSSIAGLFFYWLILINTFIMASDVMNIGFTLDLMRQTVIYLPKIAVFIMILSIGIAIGGFIDRLVYRAALLAKIPFSFFAGKAAGYMTVALSFVLALEYIGVSRSVSAQLSVIIIGLIPLLLFIMLFTGGRDAIANITASRLIHREYKAGDVVTAELFSGEITKIDLFAVTIRDKNEELIIPTSTFIQLIIKRKRG